MRKFFKSISVTDRMKKQVELHTQNSLMNRKRKKWLKEENVFTDYFY